MLRIKMLIIVTFCLANAGNYAMQYENPTMDIIDNTPFDNSPEAQARREAIITQKIASNKKRCRDLQNAFPGIQTSQQAWRVQELATNSCDQKLARRAARLAVRLEDLEAGVQPAGPRRNLARAFAEAD